MQRRFFALGLMSLLASSLAGATEIYVATTGLDTNPGTLEQPIATVARAQQLARLAKTGGAVTVSFRGGTYYLSAPLMLTSADSGTQAAPVVYQAYQNEQPIFSGGTLLTGLHWTPYQNGILQTPVPGDVASDQLFVNGERQILARYPNYDPNVLVFNGNAPDAISPERVAKWADPAGGIFHVMQAQLWGDLSYVITGKTPDGKLMLEGGWQNNRLPGKFQPKVAGDVGAGSHKKLRFVENIFEELDAPGEWFLNTKTHILYYYPPAGLDLAHAAIETVRLKSLVEFHGSPEAPVRFVSIRGITFRQTARTFMETREPILRSDWAIYRGAAIFFDGAEDCSVENSFLDQLGGNAIFVNNYNRRITLRGCQIARAGASGVVFLGDPKAARSPLVGYDRKQSFKAIDLKPGPLTDNYPGDCLVDDCLIHQTGQFEKQSAPVEIDLAQDITVRHCSIYDVPRAGINIGDGCWGGDVVEFCDIFDTVKETGDHGSFNSWGRDRWWGLRDVDLNKAIATDQPDLPRLDVVKPIILRNNRWRCDHGWDIDLDDGSSNYEIRDNLCLSGGIKLREGFYRVVDNNIMVNGTLSAHVWFADSRDVFTHNIMGGGYRPAGNFPKPWGRELDDNFIQQNGATQPQPAAVLQKQSGRDAHSLIGEAMFTDPAHGDFRVKDGSPALGLGFVNFPMDQFGVQKPELKALARTPEIPALKASPKKQARDGTVVAWNGAKLRNIRDEGEMSVYGTPGVTGVLVLQVDGASDLGRAGLHKDDVIIGCQGDAITQASDLKKAGHQPVSGQPFTLRVLRAQGEMEIKLP